MKNLFTFALLLTSSIYSYSQVSLGVKANITLPALELYNQEPITGMCVSGHYKDIYSLEVGYLSQDIPSVNTESRFTDITTVYYTDLSIRHYDNGEDGFYQEGKIGVMSRGVFEQIGGTIGFSLGGRVSIFDFGGTFKFAYLGEDNGMLVSLYAGIRLFAN